MYFNGQMNRIEAPLLQQVAQRVAAKAAAQAGLQEEEKLRREQESEQLRNEYNSLVAPALRAAETNLLETKVPENLKQLFREAKDFVEKREGPFLKELNGVLEESRSFHHTSDNRDELVRRAKAGSLNADEVVTGVTVSYYAEKDHYRKTQIVESPVVFPYVDVVKLGFSYDVAKRTFEIFVGNSNQTFEKAKKTFSQPSIVITHKKGFKETFAYNQESFDKAAEMLWVALDSSEYFSTD